MPAAALGTMNPCEMFWPANNGSVVSLSSASRAELACSEVIPAMPLFKAISRSSASSCRTSPTISRFGRIRSASLTSQRCRISPWPSRLGCRVCIATTSGRSIRSSKTSSHVTKRSRAGIALARQFSSVVLPAWVAPGTPGACITPPPAPLPRTLTLEGGFTVLDSGQRRLHRQAHAQGYSDLHSYLLARAQQQASPAQLASELATTATVVRHLLDTAAITPPPRQVTAARRRRSRTDQHLAARAGELGFTSLRAYLADRAVTRRWPSTMIASELGVQPATVRDRLDQHRLPRRRATIRPHRATARQTACWAANGRPAWPAWGSPVWRGI